MPTVHSRTAGDLAVRASPRLQSKGDAAALRVMKQEKRIMDSTDKVRTRATHKVERQAHAILPPHLDSLTADRPNMQHKGPAAYVERSTHFNNFTRKGMPQDDHNAAKLTPLIAGIDQHITANKIPANRAEMTTFRADKRDSISPYQKDDRGSVVKDMSHLSTSVATSFQIGNEQRDSPRKFGEDWMISGRSHAPMGGQGSPYESAKGKLGQGERLYARETHFKILDVEPGVNRTQVYARELDRGKVSRMMKTQNSSLSDRDKSAVLNQGRNTSDQRRMAALGLDPVRPTGGSAVKNRWTLR